MKYYVAEKNKNKENQLSELTKVTKKKNPKIFLTAGFYSQDIVEMENLK